MIASRRRVAGIDGAEIVVVAIGSRVGTGTGNARVHRALVTVVTRRRGCATSWNWSVETLMCRRSAAVFGAGESVVTLRCVAATSRKRGVHTDVLDTGVSRADIAVVAACRRNTTSQYRRGNADV